MRTGIRARLALVVGLGVIAVGAGAFATSGVRALHAVSAACTPGFADPSSDAQDAATATQYDQLDIVQFDFGLDSTGTKLRTVMTIKNLSTTIPSDANGMTYTMYWTYNGTDYATQASVGSTGAVTYSDGTISLAGGNTNYTPNATSGATGSFGSGANGQVEIDAPLSDVGGPSNGQTLTATNAFTGSNVGANGSSFGQTIDADGPGNDYALGSTTCLSSGAGGGSTPTPTPTATPTPTPSSTPTPTPTTGPTYYFHGTSTDDANRGAVLAGQAQPTATFDTTAPTGTSPVGATQTAAFDGNPNQSANSLSIYWDGPFKGAVSGALYLDWYWSTANPAALAGGDTVTITVYADPSPLIASTNRQIVQATAKINFGATPLLNHTVVNLPATCPCSVAGNLLVQVSSDTFVDAGHDNTVHYDSTAVASDFHFGPATSPSPPVSTATVGEGAQGFQNYGSPPGYQNLDGAQRQNSGEPSIGADWSTGKIMYMAGTQVSQIGFDSSLPPKATWNDVTPAQLANASEDSILFTNHYTNRTWAEDFLLNPTCNANMAYTDGDGGVGGGFQSQSSNSSWTPEQCPYETGIDHPSVGAGPYHGAPPATATDTNEIVYYCSQSGLNPVGALCTHSEDGGLTWDPTTQIFGSGSPQCGAIHGHIRVSPDGTTYVPQDNCGGMQGMAITQDNGQTYTYSVIPDSKASVTDPSVAADTANTIYFGYESGSVTSQPEIAVSKDHGKTWSASVNVGTPFGLKNVVFPEVIAGDPGRAAFAFLGTTTPGDYQAQSFRGTWYLYIAFTYDGGNSWQVVNATPNDPVQRGCVDNGGATSGYAGCRNMLDFNDITVDKQGRVYVSYTDGCTTDPNNTYSCDSNPAVNDSGCATHAAGPESTYSEGAPEYSTASCTYGRQAALVRQVCGQGLFAAHDPGFDESPACAPTASTPEAPVTAGLLLAGGAAAGLAAIGIRRRRSHHWPSGV